MSQYTKIGSIRHNDPDRVDRVVLYHCNGSDYVYVGVSGEEPEETDVHCTYHWISYAWGSSSWDLQYEPDVDVPMLE